MSRTIDDHIRTAVRMAGEWPQDVDDAVQDTWIKLLQSPTFKDAARPYGFASTTARNIVTDRIRKRCAQKRDAGKADPATVISGAATPYETLLARERLARSVHGLPLAIRETVYEAAQGWSVAESAREHRRSVGGIEKRRVTARAMVQESLEGW